MAVRDAKIGSEDCRSGDRCGKDGKGWGVCFCFAVVWWQEEEELIQALLCWVFGARRKWQPVAVSKLVGLVYSSRLSLACGESHCCSSRQWHCRDFRGLIPLLTLEEESKLGLGQVRLFSFQGESAALLDEEIRNWVCGSECHGDTVSPAWGVLKKCELRTMEVAVVIPLLAQQCKPLCQLEGLL